MPTTADEFVQQAAEAASPLFHRAVTDLGLGREDAHRLVLKMVDVYLQGRTDGANHLAQQLKSRLAADSIDAAVVIQVELPCVAEARTPLLHYPIRSSRRERDRPPVEQRP
jgi:hypothetical protein